MQVSVKLHSVLSLEPRQVGSVVSVSASHAVGRGFAPRPGHTKNGHTNGTNWLPAWQNKGKSLTSAARLSKRPGSVWNCLWVYALKTSPGINRMSRVLYPGTGFLFGATCPSKKTIMN